MENWIFGFDQQRLLDACLVSGVSIVSYLILRAVLGVLSRRLATFSTRHDNAWYGFASEVLANTNRLLLAVFSLQIGLKLVELSPRWESTFNHGWFIALALQLALWVDAGVRLWTVNYINNERHNPVTSVIIAYMVRGALWSVSLLAVLSNLGVNITAFVASLGVGGIAVALAVQTMLSDLFASLSIGVDKPFERGDFVVFGDIAGTIEHIGMKTTRIRSLSGEQIVCSNAELLKQTLHNYKRMAERRIVFGFGLSYRTPVEKVREMPGVVERIIRSTPDTRFDRAHLLAFEQTALRFEVVYIVLTADYNRYMDIQQHINLEIMQALSERDIQFAFPTQNLVMNDPLFAASAAGKERQAAAPRNAPAWQQDGTRRT
ncbi:mechanosensitive ion channel family protein [Pseudomonas mangiferae]|uniref:Mechanosensitive ion channel family protein n=1 Tax=Pseudomonas mangiferae TaxID=2593654 RepID=A0A553H4Y1_9PSED|nr:mechanosensitive ion channel family protein [Pseudomonas mangiferae]TRX76829.1 mechanosensitive ion channel family protein [Pseudomonas mangiferae]